MRAAFRHPGSIYHATAIISLGLICFQAIALMMPPNCVSIHAASAEATYRRNTQKSRHRGTKWA